MMSGRYIFSPTEEQEISTVEAVYRATTKNMGRDIGGQQTESQEEGDKKKKKEEQD